MSTSTTDTPAAPVVPATAGDQRTRAETPQPPKPPERRRRRRSPGAIALDGGLYVTLVLAALVMAFPLIWMLLASFKSNPEISTWPIQWLPQEWNFDNFIAVANSIPIGRMIFNSVFITVASTFLKVVLGLACAYALVFVDVPFKKLAFMLVLFTLLIPGQITIIPNYVLVAGLDWTNTYLGIILPGLASAFGTFLFRQQFMQLPRSLLEAAELDGAGHLRRLFRVVVPISVPTIAAVTLVTLVGEWNEYLWPSLVAKSPDLMTLPVGLTHLQDLEGIQNWGVLLAATTLLTLPMLAVFLVLQRRLVAGLTAGAVTG
ncbi:carbohydrate ABC transporter permease [Occultella aeris]|uniref:L-arabinose transport system permease protein AraQ n=1 Tax=Occultella aeris TaxID=2761496 RepID=A0A7M4DD53_9MICO|nr:carbohydrate ABC transporter permease [Occultella aeris]VZO34761.1 L-arabinose transport system permease protein AraQ [Occultella aeris]